MSTVEDGGAASETKLSHSGGVFLLVETSTDVHYRHLLKLQSLVFSDARCFILGTGALELLPVPF